MKRQGCDPVDGSMFRVIHPWRVAGRACLQRAVMAACLMLAALTNQSVDAATMPPDARWRAVRPTPATARKDLPAIYRSGCHARKMTTATQHCVFNEGGGLRVALVGDSHAAQWFPALEALAATRGWRLAVYTKSGCSLLLSPQTLETGSGEYVPCTAWGRNTLRTLVASPPDVVLFSQSRLTRLLAPASTTSDTAPMVRALSETWKVLLDHHIPVVVIDDSPRPGVDFPKCLQSPTATLSACTVRLQKAVVIPDPLPLAARAMKLPTIDMSAVICPSKQCVPIQKGLLVWRDAHHLTATYSAAVAPLLGKRLGKILKAGHLLPFVPGAAQGRGTRGGNASSATNGNARR